MIEVATFYVPGLYLHTDIPNDKWFIGSKRNIWGYNVSDSYGAQEEHEVLKWEEGLIYVGSMCNNYVHRIRFTVVQIILINIDGEMFWTESIWYMCVK